MRTSTLLFSAALALLSVVNADPRSLNDYGTCAEYVWDDPTKQHYNANEYWRGRRVYDDLVVNTDAASGDKFTDETRVKVNLNSGVGIFSTRKDRWFTVSAGISNKPGGDYWAKVQRDGSDALQQQFLITWEDSDNKVLASCWVMPNEHCHHVAPNVASDVTYIRMATRHF